MKNASQLRLVIATSIVGVAALLLASPVQSAEKGWVLEQINTYAPTGQWTVTLSDKGIKTSDGTLLLLFTAPNFDAIMANLKTRQLIPISHKEWVKTFVKDGNTWKNENSKEKWISPGTRAGHIAGLEVKQYFQYWKVHGRDQLYREFWTTTQIKLPKKNRLVLNQLCDAPNCDGVPLRVLEFSGNGKKQVILNTLEAKQVSVLASSFNKPQGFKREKSSTTVLLTIGQGKEFTDMLTESESRQ